MVLSVWSVFPVFDFSRQGLGLTVYMQFSSRCARQQTLARNVRCNVTVCARRPLRAPAISTPPKGASRAVRHFELAQGMQLMGMLREGFCQRR